MRPPILHKLDQLERRVAGHDKAIISVFDAIRQLMDSPKPTPQRRKIGFKPE
jgi:hypothetical protein